MKNYRLKNIIIILICTGIVVFLTSGIGQMQPIEDINIIAAIGQDIQTNVNNNINRIVSISSYLFEPQDKLESTLKIGASGIKDETRQVRQLSDNKQTILGLEKVIVISEDRAKFGFIDELENMFRNPAENDTAYVVICKGKASNMLGMNIKGYPSSADYIDGLIKNSVYFNFFSDKYKCVDFYFLASSEGCNFVTPYIEMKNKGIEITGMALFNKDTMVAKINVEELRIMNILRENDVKGMLKILTTPTKYINYYATSKRKVSCTKQGNKYKFTININLKGDIQKNSLYTGLQKDPKKVGEFNQEMSEEVKKDCDDFINKMKNEYKVDCLQLGQVAAAQYGRHTGVDWNHIVCNSEIEVNVKVDIVKTGRGDY